MLSLIESLGRRLNLLALFLWAPLALVAPRAMHLPLFILAATSCFSHRFKNIRLLIQPEWLLLSAFLSWALISSQWSLDPGFAVQDWVKLFSILLASASVILHCHELSRKEIDLYLKAFILGGVITLIGIIIDRSLGYSLTHFTHRSIALTYARYITLISLGIWIFLLRLPQSNFKPLMAIVVLLIMACFFWTYEFDAGPVGLLFGTGLMVMTFLVPRFTSYLLRCGCVLVPIIVILGCGLWMTEGHWQKITSFGVHSTYQQRLEMIDWASKKIIEKPLGYGFSQTRALSVKDKIKGYDLQNDQLTTTTIWEKGTWHLHNGLLQIFLELGVIGFLLIVAIIWRLLTKLWKLNLDRYRLGVMHGYITTLLFIVSVGFGIWQTWWLSTIIMLTILLSFKVNYERQIVSTNL
ncbi:O-antigen ligase family protein [Candidatus Odyssella thessalonicensis]|uniref:O-antigen ligase family protein n=1 Tax=Candidatus Odyssella thessalonicensis TaxID=84647 RepID=UPI000225A8F4|nr:O-antigen ligase family protein [Candidatus Odyssella thessalonicensis]